MATATRTRTKPTIVYYQHGAGGTVHGYDEAFLQGAFASLDMPPHLKASQKKKHPLEEIAIQIRRRILVPCAEPAEVNTLELDPELVDAVLAKERELTAQRKLAALEAARERLLNGEDVDITAYLDDSPYMPATAARVVPDPVEREPRLPGGMVDVESGPSDPGYLLGSDDVPFGDVPQAATDVVSPDRPMAAEPAGDTTPRRRGRPKQE